MKHQRLSENIIGAAYVVHKELGCGFIEKVYKNALAIQLEEAGLRCACEVPLRVLYHGRTVGEYYADIVVENEIIVEAKAVSNLAAIHEVQLVNYLRATGLTVGLLINFGRSVEVKRRVFDPPAESDEVQTPPPRKSV
jgi:GxxExxY protein